MALLTYLATALAVAQSVTVRGRVLENAETPLIGANVRLLDASGKLKTGIASNEKGLYTLHAGAGTYTLEISYIGFKTHRQELKVTGKQTTQRVADITLAEDGKLLSDLIVSAKATEVIVRGDTVEFNADSYRTTEGAALEELVKKIPGATIDESGQITINGKSISQIMIDGKRFFESDPKVALKNLPADVVDKVQVYDKQSDAARMTGFADGEDETIINLTIKPGRKKGLFGTAFAGAGSERRYELSGIVNKFTDGQQWTILGALNNTNNAGFTDIASDISNSDIARQAGGSSRRFGQRDTGNDGTAISRIIGGNLALTIMGGKGELGGSGFYGNTDKEQITKSETTNIRTSGNTVDKGNVTELNKKQTYGSDIRLEWKPDQKTEIIVMPHLSFGTGQGTIASQSTTALESTGATITTSDRFQSVDSRLYNGRLNVEMSRQLSDAGRTLALSIHGQLQGEDAEGDYTNTIYTASSGATDRDDQRLRNDSQSKSFRTRLNYVEPLGKGFALQLTYQLRGEFTDRNRAAYEKDPITGQYTVFNQDYSYDFESHYLAHRAGIAFKRATATYDLTAGVNIDPSRLESTTVSQGATTNIVQNVVNYSPTLRYTYKPSRAFNIRMDYRGQSFQPSANQLAPIQDRTNPLQVLVGNADLRPGYRHNLMGHISLFSSAKQSALNVFAHARLVQNEIVSSSTYDITTGIRTTSYTNVNGSWSVGLGGFYTTPLPWKRLSLRLGMQNSLANQVGFIDGQRNNARVLSLHESVSLGYRHGWVDTNVRGSWGFNRVNNSLETANKQMTRDYGLSWDATISLPIGITAESQLQYTATNGYAAGYDQEQTLLNLGLSYSFLKGKTATIRFKYYDVLGQKRNVFRSVTALAISSQETNTIGQYAMLHFIYRFNSFSGNASASDMKQSRRGPGGPGGPPSGPPPGAF